MARELREPDRDLGYIFILIVRIVVEKETLRKTLPDYTEYIEKVRYRLVPFAWKYYAQLADSDSPTSCSDSDVLRCVSSNGLGQPV